MKVWYGKEAEGRLKGVPTLYIQCEGELNLQAVQSLIKHTNLSHLYFGGSEVTNREVQKFIEGLIEEKFLITVETNLIHGLVPAIIIGCHIVFTIPENRISLLKDTDTIKLEAKEYIKAFTVGQAVTTPKTEFVRQMKRYEEDVVLYED